MSGTKPISIMSGRYTVDPEDLRCASVDLLEALELLHDNLAEYQRINNMGGYDNHDMRMARAAIAKAKGETT